MNNALKEMRSLLFFMKYDHLTDVEEPILFIVKETLQALKKKEKLISDHMFLINSALDKMFENINIGYWKDVSIHYRECITLLSFLKLLVYLSLHFEEENIFNDDEVFKIIDNGLIFGMPIIIKDENILNTCESLLKQLKSGNSKSSSLLTMSVVNEHNLEIDEYEKRHSLGEKIKVISRPSMQCFESEYFIPKQPIVLKNCISHWPALELWKDFNYINNVAGHRTIPIEIGSKYTDENWTQSLMTLSEFIKKHIYDVEPEKGYLAQYELFEHIPSLKNDLRIPDYCCIQESDDEDSEPNINAWFGPAGTISPTHFDPKHNLLSQIVGCKLVILFSPEESSNLYLYEDNILKNTARVDPLNPNYDIYPNYSNAKPFYTILKPGDMLYIPPKWWHYVKSLSVSFSVSFWWS